MLLLGEVQNSFSPNINENYLCFNLFCDLNASCSLLPFYCYNLLWVSLGFQRNLLNHQCSTAVRQRYAIVTGQLRGYFGGEGDCKKGGGHYETPGKCLERSCRNLL